MFTQFQVLVHNYQSVLDITCIAKYLVTLITYSIKSYEELQ